MRPKNSDLRVQEEEGGGCEDEEEGGWVEGEGEDLCARNSLSPDLIP